MRRDASPRAANHGAAGNLEHGETEPMAGHTAKTSAGSSQSAAGMQTRNSAPAGSECQVVKDGVRICEAVCLCTEDLRFFFSEPSSSADLIFIRSQSGGNDGAKPRSGEA